MKVSDLKDIYDFYDQFKQELVEDVATILFSNQCAKYCSSESPTDLKTWVGCEQIAMSIVNFIVNKSEEIINNDEEDEECGCGSDCECVNCQ